MRDACRPSLRVDASVSAPLSVFAWNGPEPAGFLHRTPHSVPLRSLIRLLRFIPLPDRKAEHIGIDYLYNAFASSPSPSAPGRSG